jgi:hypothetical protein
MIRPHKYMDLDSSLIYMSSLLVKYLLTEKSATVLELQGQLKAYGCSNIRYMIGACLNFLFLLGKIDYNQSTDSVVLLV